MNDGVLSLLFVGEGNFSFSLAIAKRQLRESSIRCKDLEIIASSYDSMDILYDKYQEFGPIQKSLSLIHFVKVLTQVNAVALEKHPELKLRRFDAIVFNHPHLGIEDFELHGALLAHFLHSAKELLKSDGQIQISLVESQSERWKLLDHAERLGFKLLKKGYFNVDLADFGFESKRNNNAQSFQNQATKKMHNSSQSSSAFVFVLAGQEGLTEREIKPLPLSIDVNDNRPVATNTSTLPFACSECEKSFSKQRGLDTHTRQVHELKLYEEDKANVHHCEQCSRAFKSRTAYQQHYLARHNLPLPLPTESVSKIVVKQGELITSSTAKNENIHLLDINDQASLILDEKCDNNDKPVSVSVSSGTIEIEKAEEKKCKTISQTIIEASDGLKVQTDICQTCLLVFDDKHMSYLQPRDVTTFTCTLCGRDNLPDKRALSQHQKFCKQPKIS
eukprot:Awhi_evm2s1724